METSTEIGKLTEALAKAQASFLPIKKTEKVDYQTTAGRKKYNYAPLDAVIDATKKALTDNGLAITQLTKLIDGNLILETILSHSSNERVVSEAYVGKQDQPPQAEGSALTYKRRYGYSAIICVASEEDDDAETATDHTKAETKQPEHIRQSPTQNVEKAIEAKQHWCAEHKCNFFKTGRMRSYAHPIKDQFDEDGKNIWCYEEKAKTKGEVTIEGITWPEDPENTKKVAVSQEPPQEAPGDKPSVVEDKEADTIVQEVRERKLGLNKLCEMLGIPAITFSGLKLEEIVGKLDHSQREALCKRLAE